MSAQRRSTKRAAIAGAVAVLLGLATVLAVTGSREPAEALKLLSGDAWLGNGANGSVSHVFGYSGKVDGSVAVSHPGDPFAIVQRPDGAYVLDLKTGRLTKVSTAGLDVSSSEQLPGKAGSLQVLASGSATWVLDHSSGILQQLNPSLKPEGPQIPLGAPTGTATLDAQGNVWAPIPSVGTVKEVTADDDVITNHPVGQPGDHVQVATTASGVWAVDPQAGRAASLATPSLAPLQIPQTAAQDDPLIAASADSNDLAVVEGDQFLDIDTSQPSLSSTTSPAYGSAVQVALNGDTAYLLDPAADQLDSVNLNPLSQGAVTAVPPGSDQLVTNDNLLFVNNVNSSQALVISSTGQVTPVTKYIPGATPSPSPGATGPVTAPSNPLDNGAPTGSSGPLQSPGGDQQGQGGPTPVATPSGGGSSPATTATTPPTTTPPTTPPSPAAPTQPTITSVAASAGSLTANWSPPASSGTSAITKYNLSVTSTNTAADPTTHTATGGASDTSAAVGGLKGGLTYCAQIQAVNSAGAGPLSTLDTSAGAPDCATTTSDTPGQVATPSVAGGVKSVAVTWTAASLGPYNTAISSYTVTVTPKSGGQATTATVTSGLSTTVSGLDSGATYDVSVYATNASGNKGPASSAASAETDTAPTKPPGLTVDATNAGELTATWNDQSANNGQKVTYTANVDGNAGTVNGDKAVFDNLSSGSHTVTVTATDPGGTGTASGTGDVWVRNMDLENCYSLDKYNYWVDTETSCGGTSNTAQPEGTADFGWPTSTAAPGDVPLYVSYGTPNGTASDNNGSEWYYTGSDSTPPGPWIPTEAGTVTGYVWTSASAAPSGAYHLCEAEETSPQGTQYFDLYTYGGSHTSCVEQFWS